MKKLLRDGLTGLMIGFTAVNVFAAAGTQYNWGTSTGANWLTPDDTIVGPNQALTIGSSGGAQVSQATQMALSGSVAISTATTTNTSNGQYVNAFLGGSTAALEGSLLCSTTTAAGQGMTVIVCPTTNSVTTWAGVARSAVSTGSVVGVYYAGFVLALTTGTVNPGDVLVSTQASAGFMALNNSPTSGTDVAIAVQAGVASGGLTRVRLR